MRFLLLLKRYGMVGLFLISTTRRRVTWRQNNVDELRYAIGCISFSLSHLSFSLLFCLLRICIISGVNLYYFVIKSTRHDVLMSITSKQRWKNTFNYWILSRRYLNYPFCFLFPHFTVFLSVKNVSINNA